MANIYLIGMRGVGKTTIATLLAQHLGKEYRDTDLEMAKELETDLTTFVDEQGWDAFREQEHKTLMKVLQHQDCVVSTGGGIVMHFNNAEQIKQAGVVIWLKAPVTTLVKRLKESASRPSLTDKNLVDEVKSVLKKREPIYKSSAHIIVNTNRKSPENVVLEIISQLD